MSSYNPGAMPTFLSTCKVINIPPSNTHLNLAELSWLPTCWLHLVSLSFLEAHVLHRLLNCGCTRVRTWRPFACLQHSVDLRTGSAPLCRGLKSIGGLPMTFKSLHTVVQTSFLPDLPHSDLLLSLAHFICSLNIPCICLLQASCFSLLTGMPLCFCTILSMHYPSCKTQSQCQSLQETFSIFP